MHNPPSLRPDLQVIADLIPSESCVLDIGCGDGDLLAWLKVHKSVEGRGLELKHAHVSNCMARGLSVIQGDAEIDIAYYPGKAFDYAVLSKALQVMVHPKEVLLHMVRIAHYAIVSIPNFGHWHNRFYLMLKGRMPMSKTLSYAWYETPNIHFSTLKDFIALCDSLQLTIDKSIAIREDGHIHRFRSFGGMVNLLSEQAVFVIREG